jgi:hypothetical protein
LRGRVENHFHKSWKTNHQLKKKLIAPHTSSLRQSTRNSRSRVKLVSYLIAKQHQLFSLLSLFSLYSNLEIRFVSVLASFEDYSVCVCGSSVSLILQELRWFAVASPPSPQPFLPFLHILLQSSPLNFIDKTSIHF